MDADDISNLKEYAFEASANRAVRLSVEVLFKRNVTSENHEAARSAIEDVLIQAINDRRIVIGGNEAERASVSVEN